MSATFKGHRTGFKPGTSNACVPNEFGPPATTFKGRGAVPEGALKRHPGAVADTDDGNRRLAKAKHGTGADDGVSFGGHGGFGGKGK